MKKLLDELKKAEPNIEWTLVELEVKGNTRQVIEGYNPLTEKGLGISLGDYPKSRDIEKLVDTIIAKVASDE